MRLPRTWTQLGLKLESLQNGSIDMEEIPVSLPNLPPDLSGLRLALVSDLHMGRAYPRAMELLALLRDARPDLICILGDMIDSTTPSLGPLKPLLTALTQLAPTIAVLGNNDYIPDLLPSLRRAYEAVNILLLEDETRLFPRGRSALRILGVQDPMGLARGLGKSHPKQAPNTQTLGQVLQTPMTTLLLIHQVQRALDYRDQGIDLALGGHAHGGQFRLPLLGALYAPGQGILPSYTSGLYRLPGLNLVASRGLGNHGFPIRIGNRPHVPVVVLKGAVK